MYLENIEVILIFIYQYERPLRKKKLCELDISKLNNLCYNIKQLTKEINFMKMLIGNYSQHFSYYIIDYFNGKYSLKKSPTLNNCSYLCEGINEEIIGVNETKRFDNSNSGSIFSSSINESEIQVNSIVSSDGLNPCHIQNYKNYIYVSNYDSGTLSIFYYMNKQITHLDTLYFLKNSQIHCTLRCNHKLLVVDKGESQIHLFHEVNGKHIPITSLKFPSDSYPRHIIKGHNNFYYVIAESNKLYTLYLDDCLFEIVNKLDISTTNSNEAASAIKLSSNLDTIFTTIRGTNLIRTFVIDKHIPRELETIPSGGITPRDIDVQNNDIVVCNTDSNNISIFNFEKQRLVIQDTLNEIEKPAFVKIKKNH